MILLLFNNMTSVIRMLILLKHHVYTHDYIDLTLYYTSQKITATDEA